MKLIKSIFGLALFTFLLALSACSNVPISLPAISQENTGIHYEGRVIWHDLLVRDKEAAQKFYGALFGWEFKEVGLFGASGQSGSYSLILHQGRPIAGMVDTTQLRKDVNLVQWVSVFSTADIDSAIGQIETGGGTVHAKPTSVGERGKLAVVADPQGGLFGLLQTKLGDPAERKPAVGEFLWDELWTSDTEQATHFYQQLFGYNSESAPLKEDEIYHYFTSADKPRAAVISNPIAGLDTTWATFIRVEDPASIVAKVEGLGGEVLLDVQENSIGGQIAIIRDPDGAGFVIQTWER